MQFGLSEHTLSSLHSKDAPKTHHLFDFSIDFVNGDILTCLCHKLTPQFAPHFTSSLLRST